MICGKGCTSGIRTCKNIAYISMILWGYVLIWYSPWDGMFIFRTSCRPTYRDRVEDGRAWFDGCGEQSHLWGNQGLCTGAYGIESQQSLNCTGKTEMRYYGESKL